MLTLIENVNPAVMPEWVREISALAALIFVVYWFTRSMDRRDKALIDAVASFKAFEMEEHRTHEGIQSELNRQGACQADMATKLAEIVAAQRELVAMIGELRSKTR